MNIPLPDNEAKRLEVLRQYDILDTLPEPAFDDLTLLAAQICQTPIAMVSLVDEHRQWFKSRIGIEAAEAARDIGFCARTILNLHEVMEVCDASGDPRFAASLLVPCGPCIRFYAGAPLVTPDGHALGALCVMAHEPRTLTGDQRAALRALSRQAVAQLELRRQAARLAREVADRRHTEALLNGQFEELSASKAEADRLLALGEKSRRALLSVLEDEKLAGESLRASEERFRQLADNIHEIFWICSPPLDKILYVSPAYEKIWGRSCDSLYQSPRDWLEAVHPDDRERVRDASMIRVLTEGYSENFRIIRPDGSVRWIHDQGFPVRNAAGEVYRIVGVAEDITEKRELEEQYRQAQKMEAIGQLAGGVAHDFNNILAVIQMQSELLKTSGSLSADQSEFVEEIGTTVERAATLTRQLLLFSSREVFQPRDLDLNETIGNTVKMLRRILGADVRVQLRLASQPMFLHADPGMMDQVLLNLAVNARDAMPHGGQLIIESTGIEFDEFAVSQSAKARVGSFVRLSVSDSGCGIPAEILSKIFEPFFTTKGVGKGTGLGLATVFGVVQQHGGWIDVYSEVGHGTTFRVYLPRLARNAIASSLPAGPAVMRGGNETILLAEDDPSLRVSIRKTLTQLGYRIVEAPTGNLALKVWEQNRAEIRLLLTDLVMPDGMTGKELAQRLRQEEPQLRVIYMSGYSAEVAGKDFPLKEGVNFLTKPFPAAKLAQTIRAVLNG
ncbi:MAG TPA: ATP-binding protein [Candidatus Limnocylindria bacterium]|jgi:PAS domain S-box-containing protein|nr:ATP-binding protein [Candidatus Limnocylindria bacterium]